MKDTAHGFNVDLLNNFIHIRIMKGVSYEGSPVAKAQEVETACKLHVNLTSAP